MTIRLLLLAMMLLGALLPGCGGSGGSTGDPDREVIVDREPDEPELLCTPRQHRCAAGVTVNIEACSLDGAQWYLYRVCGSAMICREGGCVPDGSEPDDDPDMVVENENEPADEFAEEAETPAEESDLEPGEETEFDWERPEWEPFEEWEASPCPDHPEMAWLGSYFCIDRYESSLSFNRECQEPFVDWNSVLPDGFPDCVGCEEYHDCWPSCSTDLRQPQTVPLFACSLELIPIIQATYFQARQACENAGKRICTIDEWRRACAGPNFDRLFPYGNDYALGACVDSGGDKAAKRRRHQERSGSFPECETPEGVFDLSGNVDEHVFDRLNPEYPLLVSGGSFWNTAELANITLSCLGELSNYYDPEQPDTGIKAGFRCCLGNWQ